MAPNPDALRVITEILNGEQAEKASTNDPAERYGSLIRQMYGAARKATPVNPTIKAVAERHGVTPFALVDALRDLAKGGATKSQPAQTIADVVRSQRKSEPARGSINDAPTARSIAAGMERVRESADAVAAEHNLTPLGRAIRQQLRELT